MTETQKRIRAYKKALPELRERVIAVALLLLMSASMLSSASFAWLTISRRPEVTAVNTTVAANGSLEIALVDSDGAEPDESKVGDSSSTKGQSVTAANITWGNLVNLSDSSYGLENLTLRPAQLNTASLLSSPLYGAVYSSDGRITQLTSNFGYTTWNEPEGDKPGYFGVSTEYGVRAISSTKIEAVGAAATYVRMLDEAVNTNTMAGSTYLALGSNDKYMPSLATMMGLYMTARMNPDDASLSNPTCNIADVQNLRDMYAAFLEAFDKEAEAMAALANLQLFLLHGEGAYTPYTAEMIYGTTTSALKAEGIQITNLDQFIKDKNTIASDLEKLIALCTSGNSLAWKDSGLNDIVNNLVNVGACTIGADNTPISSIGASNAMGYLSGTQEARITNGILYRFEERTGAYIDVKNLSISATVKRSGFTVPATVKANIQTTAPRDYFLFNNDKIRAEGLNTGNFKGGTAVAEDTYGLAIDLWVRTNAANSYLTLEGNVLTETESVRATGKDANGNTVELYTITRSADDGEGGTVSYSTDIYQIVTTTENEDGTTTETTTWYSADNHTVLTEDDLGDSTPVAKMEEVVTVVGYEGENRIWDNDKTMMSTDATTQGSGSCYVYYADTPEDQARSLKLLEAFNVAFVDQYGKLMATAEMDTERYFAENGRVIVPLVLSASNSINLGEDYQGEVTYAITDLEQNVATRITAIVYLDGTKLTNQDVLSAADIQGKLNIQFGSSTELNAIANEELETQELRVSATVDKTSFDWDTGTDFTTNVTVNVDGSEPTTVTAFFLRAISDSQGSREQEMTFMKNADGDWVSSYAFTAPGNYVLRTVRLDGVDYDLAEPQRVTVTGFTVNSLTQEGGSHINVMSAASSSTVNLTLQFASDDVNKMPKTVQGRYLRDDGSAVNVNFTYNSTTGLWTGSATFLTSGEYTMQYLVLDGDYVQLDSGLHRSASVTLGMRVAVYTTSPHQFKYVPSEMTENMKNLAMQVKIMDNAGNELPGLSGVKLVYGMKGSGIKTMDADLTWNGSYYVGSMPNGGPGIWQFSTVTVGGNTLTNATTYPTFTIQSPEPPEYHDHSTVAYQYKPNNDAVMNAQITNSAAAQVQAYIIRDGAATGEWVTGTIGGEFTTTSGKPANNWNFAVPKDANGYQDGNWTLTALKLWDVFAADGTEYTETMPLEFNVSGTNNVTKVVSRVYATFANDLSQNFGKNADGTVTGNFLESHTISGLNVDIKDFEGQPVTGVSNVQLKFTYVSGTSVSNGGYSRSDLSNVTEGAAITVPLVADSTGTHFVQNADATILYAGNYTTEFSYTIGSTYKFGGDSGNALPGNAPVFSVWSKVPGVTITGITPTGTHNVDKTTSGSIKDSTNYELNGKAYSGTYRYYWITNGSHVTGYTSSYNSTTATVYFMCDHTNTTNYGYTSWYGYGYVGLGLAATAAADNVDYHDYTQPTVTITLANMGNAKNADLSFGDSALIFASAGGSDTTKTTYSWSANGAATRYIGIWSDSSGNDGKTVAGTITASQLVLTDSNGAEYTVTLTTPIKIVNEY